MTVAAEWLKDAEALSCVACSRDFTLLRRRHHCRRCGGVFCGECSPHRIPLLSLGYIDAVRVCANCLARERGSSGSGSAAPAGSAAAGGGGR